MTTDDGGPWRTMAVRNCFQSAIIRHGPPSRPPRCDCSITKHLCHRNQDPVAGCVVAAMAAANSAGELLQLNRSNSGSFTSRLITFQDVPANFPHGHEIVAYYTIENNYR